MTLYLWKGIFGPLGGMYMSESMFISRGFMLVNSSSQSQTLVYLTRFLVIFQYSVSTCDDNDQLLAITFTSVHFSTFQYLHYVKIMSFLSYACPTCIFILLYYISYMLSIFQLLMHTRYYVLT